VLFLSGCLDHDPIPGGSGESFIAMQADFAGYLSWEAYPVSSADTGHSEGERVVYLNQKPEAGAKTFPVGTILVKVIDGSDIHAMAKRGAGFNLDGAVGWEWFELLLSEGEPVIKWRGASAPEGESYGALPGTTEDSGDSITGDCNVCHGAAANNDYVQSVSF
jgi:hypothetical protein